MVLPDSEFRSDDPNFVRPDEQKSDAVASELSTNCRALTPKVLVEVADLDYPSEYTTLRGSLWEPRIAAASGRYAVVWQQLLINEEGYLRGVPGVVMVDAEGEVLTSARALSETFAGAIYHRPRIAAVADGFAVAWPGFSEDNKHDIFYQLIDLEGSELASAQLTETTAAQDAALPRQTYVASNSYRGPDQLTMLWRDREGLEGVGLPTMFVRSFDDQGEPQRLPQPVVGTNMELFPHKTRIVALDDGFAVAWYATSQSDSSSYGGTMYYGTISNLGEVRLPPHRLGEQPKAKRSLHTPDMLWTGKEVALVYVGTEEGEGDVVFARFRPDGGSIASHVLQLPGNNVCQPALTYNGSHYAVAWQNDCNEPGARILLSLIDAGTGRRLDQDAQSCPANASGCGVLVLSEEASDQYSEFPSLISVEGEIAAVWNDRSSNRIYFNQVICEPSSG